jgi:hypothetical protein
VIYHKHAVCTFFSSFIVTLSNIPKFLPECCGPNFFCDGIVGKFLYLNMVSLVTGCMTGAQKCSMFASFGAKFLLVVFGLDVTKSAVVGVHAVSALDYAASVRLLTAS